VRLVIAKWLRGLWVRLEPETPEQTEALEACAARGEWTNGRGVEAIVTLRALADRLGYPVGAPVRQRIPSPPPPRMVVVQRGDPALYEQLRTFTWEGAPVIWDRRQGERRTVSLPTEVDRRRRDRRRPPPETWATLRFILVRAPDTSA
jgi:hypothetical protein